MLVKVITLLGGVWSAGDQCLKYISEEYSKSGVDLKAIEVRDLVKVYGHEVRALDSVSLDVEDSTVHALLGPNGAGKTTLIRVITTQLKPNSGYARVFGYDVTKESSEVRSLIGYVPQEVSLWSDLSGYENMLIYSKIYGIPREIRGRKIEELLDFMGLSEASGRLVRTYSGGMIRRLEIAIALMRNPRLLILDEPTIGLDPGARSLVWDKISEFRRENGVTVFFATHYMDEADKYADYVTLLNQGRVVSHGSPNELKRHVEGNKVLITLKNNTDSSRLSEVLSSVPGVTISSFDNNCLEVVVSDVPTRLPAILEKIFVSGYSVSEVKIREATLDEVFIKLTGRRISDESGRMKEVVSVRKMIRRG
ncbi:MAG: ATP-binding cassette domain-containing protein, partial [Zestosphaera sp.]